MKGLHYLVHDRGACIGANVSNRRTKRLPKLTAGSRISGTVVDPTDNTIPGATVVLQGPGSRDRYTTLANDNGFFQFEGVKSGTPYRVMIHAHGFADWTSPALVLDPGQYKILTDCKLRLPDVETTINVGYSSAQVATQQVKAAEKQRLLGIVPNFYAVYDRILSRLPPN